MQQASRSAAVLFTDIEGSTKLWEEQPERMSRALKAHDTLARTAIEGHRGTIVKMFGDGLFAVFDEPADALAAALALLDALADPQSTDGIRLNVRCGLHVGAI